VAGFRRLALLVKSQYDRWIAFVILLGLVISVLYLAFRIGTIRSTQAKFEGQIEALQPEHPSASDPEGTDFRKAVELMAKPPQLVKGERGMFVPETRVWCVDCKRPIDMTMAVKGGRCPFCDAVQPPDAAEVVDYDGDKDGMWDSWERAHGLDPFDPDDAEKDTDGDDYSNIAEFRADPRTDPRDPKRFPPPEAELRVVKILADPFMLRFKAKSRLPSGLQFQINLLRGGRTYFRKLGEDVEGFKLADYEERIVKKTTGSSAVAQWVDESVLTLERGAKRIPLVYNKDVQHDEYTAVLFFKIDGTQYTVKQGAEFHLKGNKYRVLGIDSAAESVVVKRLNDGKELVIRKFPETEGD